MRAGALAIDVVVAGAITLAGVAALEWRRRRRQHALQVTLAELACLTLFVAAIASWMAFVKRGYDREQLAAKRMSAVVEVTLDDVQPEFLPGPYGDPPSLIERLVPRTNRVWLERRSYIELVGPGRGFVAPQDLAAFHELAELAVVQSAVRGDDLPHVVAEADLRMLFVSQMPLRHEVIARLTRATSLTRISLSEVPLDLHDIAALADAPVPGRMLRIAHVPLDADMIDVLARSKTVTKVILFETGAHGDDIGNRILRANSRAHVECNNESLLSWEVADTYGE